MRPSEVLRRASAYLERHDVQSPEATAERLLMHVLRTDRTGLYTRSEALDTQEARLFGRALCQRCVGAPLQHLTGEQAFRRLVLEVRPGVFVPRPETELVVERGLERIRDVASPVVVDVGTGTGAIALAIADERPDATVTAIDVDPAAVELARVNATRSGLDVTVLEGDLLEPLTDASRGRVDLVVSNPPYVAPEEVADLPLEVRADPELALVGGLGLYRRLATQARDVLRPGGSLVLEIGETMAEEVVAMLAGGYAGVEVERDLAGRERIVLATRT